MTPSQPPVAGRRSVQRSPRSARTRVGWSSQASSADVAAEARALVVRAVAHRGAAAWEVRDGRRIELEVESTTGRRRVHVSSQRHGDWQASRREGETGQRGDDRTWVPVDLAPNGPDIYHVPEWWVADDIRREREGYLARIGVMRARTPDPEHQRIQTGRLTGLRDRWDLPGEDGSDEEAGQ